MYSRDKLNDSTLVCIAACIYILRSDTCTVHYVMQCIKEEELIGVSEAQKERWGKIYVKLVKNSLLSDS